MSEKIYVAMAYRCGAYNDHKYLVDVGTDLQQLIESAERESEHRGGKYGIEIKGYYPPARKADGEIAEGDLEHYIPSKLGETEPGFNPRIVRKTAAWANIHHAVTLDGIEGNDLVELVRRNIAMVDKQ